MERKRTDRPYRNRPALGGLLPRLALGAILALAAGCFLHRPDGLVSPLGRGGDGGPRDRASGSLPTTIEARKHPDLDPSLAGNPYRELRRHTSYALGEVSGIDVSPDGKAILYASSQDGPTPNIYLKDEDGSVVVRRTSGHSWDLQPRFSPDGRWIAFASNRDGNFDIWVIPARGAGSPEQVTSSPEDEVHPSWSPDGKRIAFCRLSREQGWSLWVLDREKGSLSELGSGLFPDWSPTGEWIAFQKASDREPRWFGIWIIHPDGGELRQVVAGDGYGAMAPSWSPGGDLLAFAAVRKGSGDARRSSGGDLWMVETRRGKMYQLTDGGANDAEPAWGLGGRIYFSSERDGTTAIWSLIPPEVDP